MRSCLLANTRYYHPASPTAQERGINLPELPDSDWDQPLGLGSGAGVLFGTTGGVMEAALRTVSEQPPAVPTV